MIKDVRHVIFPHWADGPRAQRIQISVCDEKIFLLLHFVLFFLSACVQWLVCKG